MKYDLAAQRKGLNIGIADVTEKFNASPMTICHWERKMIYPLAVKEWLDAKSEEENRKRA